MGLGTKQNLLLLLGLYCLGQGTDPFNSGTFICEMGTMKFPSQKFKGINKIIFITDEKMRLKEAKYSAQGYLPRRQNRNPNPEFQR